MKRHQWAEAQAEAPPETPSEPQAAQASNGTAANSSTSESDGAGQPPEVTALVAGLSAGAAQVVSRYSYPKIPGDSPISAVDVAGPASYTVVTVGTPPTGGQTVPASTFGLQALDFVWAQGSNNGQYDVTVFPLPFTLGDSFPSVMLMWSVAATGAQVTAATNLGAIAVRLFAIGR